MSGSLRTPVPSATVYDTRVMFAVSPASPSRSSSAGSSRTYRISMSVIAHTMWALLLVSITREGLESEVELFAPISVLEISTVSTPFVEISAYWSRGWEPFSIQTR